MATSPLNYFLAIKGVSLVSGLRPSDRHVGIIIIDHYDRRSSRCDPALERLADLPKMRAHSDVKDLVWQISSGAPFESKRVLAFLAKLVPREIAITSRWHIGQTIGFLATRTMLDRSRL